MALSIKIVIIPGKVQDDLVLEVVIFLGTAAADEDCAQVICKADMLMSLIELLKGSFRIHSAISNSYCNMEIFEHLSNLPQFIAKQEDDEMVLQIIYVFYQVSKHESTRHYLIRETGNGKYLITAFHPGFFFHPNDYHQLHNHMNDNFYRGARLSHRPDAR